MRRKAKRLKMNHSCVMHSHHFITFNLDEAVLCSYNQTHLPSFEKQMVLEKTGGKRFRYRDTGGYLGQGIGIVFQTMVYLATTTFALGREE